MGQHYRVRTPACYGIDLGAVWTRIEKKNPCGTFHFRYELIRNNTRKRRHAHHEVECLHCIRSGVQDGEKKEPYVTDRGIGDGYVLSTL